MFCSKCGEEKKDSTCPNCGNTDFTPYKLKDLKWDKPKESENRNIYAVTLTPEQEAEEWYYVLRGERYGPVSRLQFLNLYKNEKVFLSTKVWKVGMPGWVDVNQTDLIDLSIYAVTLTPEQEAEEWYYVLRGERYGPVSRLQFLNLYKNEKVFLSTKVWKAGMPGWADVNQTDLIDLSNQPPPLQGDDINNSIVWVLAFVPIIGPIIENIISGAIGTSGSLWFVTTILNTILCITDEQRLKRAGYNTKEMLLWAIFLVPVYLFRRAHLLKQKNVYAIVWCITFAILILTPL